jgi:hypothetical protein
LPELDGHASGFRAAILFDIGERGFAVDLRLALSEPV